MRHTLYSLLKKPVLYVPFALVLFGAGWFFLRPDSDASRYETAVAEIRNVLQAVSVTGRVEPLQSAEISFERSGVVSSVRVAVGEKVSSGAALMTLANDDFLVRVEQAIAGRIAAEAGLAEILSGARPEERAIKEARSADAVTALSEAKRALFDEMQDTYAKADDAIRNKADQLFENPRSARPTLTFLSSYKEELQFKRFLLENELAGWNAERRAITETNDLSAFADGVRAHVEKINEFLDIAALAVNSLTAGSVSQVTIDGYKANIASARAAMSRELAELSSARGGVRSHESALAVAESERRLTLAGATKEAINAARARVDEARAGEKGARAELSKTVLIAPFTGTVSKITPRVGEFAGASVSVISLISSEKLKLEVFVPEADVVKVHTGNDARVVLDAYGTDREFMARVVDIEPEATLFDGVPTYKTILYFVGETTGVRAGMTADIDIKTGEREGVLAIPQRAVETRQPAQEGKTETYVRVLSDDDVPQEKVVITGLRGTDGLIEIVEGIEAGARVITFEQ
ncbi:MAG: efflux RND transporter periplasmic adaptor subunit [Parcubacteria group bacterium]|nr:efflux RND transporter periplasmic adaptor subunit [Parcubacteria group bacterium]